MRMNRFLVSGVALLGIGALVVGTANAQEEPGAGRGNRQGRGQRQGGRGMNPQAVMVAFKAVNPTEEQQKKFDDLQTKMREAMGKLQDLEPQERMGRMREIMTRYQTATEEILTDEQKPKFQEELRKAQQPNMMNALVSLNLTDEQKKQIEPIAKETQEAMAQAMRSQDVEPQERRQKMTELMDGFKAKIRPMLNTEQQGKLDMLNLMGGRGGRGGFGGGRPNRGNDPSRL